MNLHDRIASLATTFATNVLDLVRTSPLSDLVEVQSNGHSAAPTTLHVNASLKEYADAHAIVAERRTLPFTARKSSGRLARRSPAQIAAVVDNVVALLAKAPHGLRSENIRTALNLDVRELPRVLKEALASKKIRIASGQKRATTYVTSTRAKGGVKEGIQMIGRAMRSAPSKKPSSKAAPKKAAATKKPTKKAAKKPAAVETAVAEKAA